MIDQMLQGMEPNMTHGGGTTTPQNNNIFKSLVVIQMTKCC